MSRSPYEPRPLTDLCSACGSQLRKERTVLVPLFSPDDIETIKRLCERGRASAEGLLREEPELLHVRPQGSCRIPASTDGEDGSMSEIDKRRARS